MLSGGDCIIASHWKCSVLDLHDVLMRLSLSSSVSHPQSKDTHVGLISDFEMFGLFLSLPLALKPTWLQPPATRNRTKQGGNGWRNKSWCNNVFVSFVILLLYFANKSSSEEFYQIFLYIFFTFPHVLKRVIDLSFITFTKLYHLISRWSSNTLYFEWFTTDFYEISDLFILYSDLYFTNWPNFFGCSGVYSP